MNPLLAEEPAASACTSPLAWTLYISSLGALAAQLRSNRKLTWRNVTGAVATSIVAGTLVHLMLDARLHDDPGMHIFVSALAGVGGASTIEFLLAAVRARAGGPPQ